MPVVKPMMKRQVRWMAAVLLGLASVAVSAADKVQLLVETASSGADGSGALFSGSLQKALNETGRYMVVSTKDGAAFYATISTMGMDEVNQLLQGGAMLSLYKVVLMLRLEDGALYYLNSWAGYTGQDRAKEMADAISKAIAKDLDDAVSAIQASAKAQKK